ncbi:helix-turn-helix domain-containing protein [Streptomyces botrytidirepellens]|uniref:XRE family transcriptional regulator n=1 Tax=Streptomyces botrytidirepellens TaxID=2486417 RepID=A0A3M8VRT1_9ACTN|nr:helix-turn-helix domain-containing protein [Streptomyces botrytidirepellens]RNG20404.1 XRE family transcriptional regulator [Streptomyces botrytidirepellens]
MSNCLSPAALPPHVLDRSDVRRALERHDFGAVFKLARQWGGISFSKIADACGIKPERVGKLARGEGSITTYEKITQIADALRVPGHLVGLSPRPWESDQPRAAADETAPIASLELPSLAPDPDLLDRLTRTVRGATRADGATLDWLDRLLAEHRKAEDDIGSRPLVGIMRQQLATVVGLHDASTGSVATRVVRLASEHAQFLAWMAQDQGDSSAALAWYDRSHDWAMEAGDADMAATTLSMKAHLAWSAGDGRRCARLAQAARWASPGTSRGVQGMAAQMEARGYALSGEADAAHRLLDEAQHLIARAAERPEDEPPWMYFYGENWFTLQRGMAEMHLHRWDTAVDLLRTGIDALPASYRRDRSWYGACLAHALAAAGHADAAAYTALGCTADASDVGRPHAWNELHTTAALLLRRGAPQARGLVDALADCG